ncbi:MAG: cytochrome c maturation protein CcmE [Acidobacteria bacterium]|nr:cytochrome c maturation protein CcmE [Acidobacteriota bacterium]
MKPYMKFGLIIGIVVATLGWLAVGGVKETSTYYKTVAELKDMGDRAQGKRLRVGGDVVKGSIHRNGKEVSFHLVQAEPNTQPHLLKVTYTGSDPLPDTFRDDAQALADGHMNADGTFNANKIQAKCASKYEAKPGQIKPGSEPAYNTAKPSRS